MTKRRVLYWLAPGAAMALAVGGSSPSLDPVRAGTFSLVHVAGVEDAGASADNPLGRLKRLAEPSLRGGRDRMHGVLTTVSGGVLTRSGSEGPSDINLLNEVGVEVATPSDREFALTETEFRSRVRRASFTVIANNLTDAAGQQFKDMPKGIVMPVKLTRD